MSPRRIPIVIDGHLVANTNEPLAIEVGSQAWFAWLCAGTPSSFSYQTPHGAITIRPEKKRQGWYWYAYHATQGSLRKSYWARQTPSRQNACAWSRPHLPVSQAPRITGSPGCITRCAHDVSRHAARDALWARRHPDIDESHRSAGVSGQPRTPAASRTFDGALVARKPNPTGAEESAQSSLVDPRPAWLRRAGWS